MERRAFLATTGAGAGVAVSGVGPTSAGAGDTDRASNGTREVLTTFTAEVERFELGCLTWNATPVFTIEGEIYADGSWKSTDSAIVLPEKSSVCIALVAPPDDAFQILSSLGGQFDPEELLTATFTFGVFGPEPDPIETAEFTLTTGTSGDNEGSLERTKTATAQATLVKGGDGSAEDLRDWPVELDMQMDVADPSALSPLVDGEIVEPVVGNTPPQDLDGDGLYENVRGDGEFDIMDVQALFDNLDTETVQSASAAFNFSGGDPDRVTVLDVQGLFTQLRRS
jgi:PKD repeat protein